MFTEVVEEISKIQTKNRESLGKARQRQNNGLATRSSEVNHKKN